MSTESFGHCPPCTAKSVQPYRKAVKPENCNVCQAYEAGIEQGRKDAAIDVSAIDWPANRQTLGVMKFWSAATIAARGAK